MPIGDLAAQDEYDPFAAEKFVNPAVQGIMGGIADQVKLPGQLMAPNPYPPGSEEADFYDASKAKGATDWAPGMALNTMGTGAIMGVPVKGAEAVLGAGPIRAYHSSPYDFDKFDMSKIGTGEGAQVYGHGLYFAENPAVSGQGGQYWKAFAERFKEGPEAKAVQYLKSNKMDREAAAKAIEEEISAHRQSVERGENYLSAESNAKYQNDLAQARDLLVSDKPVGPRTYEVDINADPAHFLDWNKPLSQQPKAVQPIAEDVLRNPGRGVGFVAEPRGPTSPISGGNLYNALAHRGERNFPAATKAFEEAGIPGIKYLDQGSRKTLNPAMFPTHAAYQDALTKNLIGEGQTHNYVVFNPGIIDIMKKYGLAGAAPAGLGALAAQDQYGQEGYQQ